MRPRIQLKTPPRMKILPQGFSEAALTKAAKEFASRKDAAKNYMDVSGGDGLLARITNEGSWSYMVKYKVKGERTYRFITIGDPTDLTVESAYNAAKAIRALADQGVDIRTSARKALIRDLLKRK